TTWSRHERDTKPLRHKAKMAEPRDGGIALKRKKMDRISQAKNLAERLLGTALDVVGEAQVTLDENWARNPKVVGLTLLSRSLTNFHAAIILLNDWHVHVVEARALARCIYENLIWIGALRERGLNFVKKMLNDDAANKPTLGELVMKISRK